MKKVRQKRKITKVSKCVGVIYENPRQKNNNNAGITMDQQKCIALKEIQIQEISNYGRSKRWTKPVREQKKKKMLKKKVI